MRGVMRLMHTLMNALHRRAPREFDPNIAEIQKRQGQQIDRIQRMIGDDWRRDRDFTQQRLDAWRSEQERQG